MEWKDLKGYALTGKHPSRQPWWPLMKKANQLETLNELINRQKMQDVDGKEPLNP